MKLAVHTMRKTVFAGESARITAPTPLGEITILENHEPYVTMLAPGEFRYEDESGQEAAVPIRGGFLEVRRDSDVRVLAD